MGENRAWIIQSPEWKKKKKKKKTKKEEWWAIFGALIIHTMKTKPRTGCLINNCMIHT